MAGKNKPQAPPERLTSRQRREQREIRRRERLMAKSQRNPGLRERVIGCGFSSLIVGGVLFLLMLIGGAIYYYVIDR